MEQHSFSTPSMQDTIPTQPRKPKFRPSNKPMTRSQPSTQRDPRRKHPDEVEGEPDFTPKALSTTLTSQKNDPLDIDAFSVLDLAGLTCRKRVPKLQLNYSGYFDLIETTYDMMAQDPYWTRYVSAAAWTYYCVMLLWERLFFIGSIQGDVTAHYSTYMDLKSSMLSDICIPKGIAVYLASLGPVRDPNGRTWHLHVPELDPTLVNNLAGFFGQVDADTHHQYGSTPSPGVAALAVLVEATAPQNIRNWNLPVDLRPAGDDATIPSRNLLGWRPCIPGTLSDELRQQYTLFRIEGRYDVPTGQVLDIEFGVNKYNLPICTDLIRYISNKLAERITSIVVGPVETTVGSQTQLGFVVANDPAPLNRRATERLVGPRSYTQLVSARGNAIAVFKPRVMYSDIDANYIYQFRQGTRRPDPWADSRNAPLEHDQSALINADFFGLCDIDGIAAIQGFVQNIRIYSRMSLR